MEIWDTFISFTFGILLRLAIPILLTVLLVYWLRRIDRRWQEQAKQDGLSQVKVVMAKNIGCYQINNCSVESRSKCKAYANQDIPCWQNFRDNNGALKEKCLVCKVFRQAPIPVTA